MSTSNVASPARSRRRASSLRAASCGSDTSSTPASSNSSRNAACSAVSPGSTLPPGKTSALDMNADARWRRTMKISIPWSRWRTTITLAAGVGMRSGYHARCPSG